MPDDPMSKPQFRPMAWTDEAKQNFRWAYALLLELAQEELRKANAEREHDRDWPAGQTWSELVPSSQNVFMRKARERAGIDHDEFLRPIREGLVYVGDLCDQAMARDEEA